METTSASASGPSDPLASYRAARASASVSHEVMTTPASEARTSANHPRLESKSKSSVGSSFAGDVRRGERESSTFRGY